MQLKHLINSEAQNWLKMLLWMLTPIMDCNNTRGKKRKEQGGRGWGRAGVYSVGKWVYTFLLWLHALDSVLCGV